jgi:hypothetical protein
MGDMGYFERKEKGGIQVGGFYGSNLKVANIT